MLLQRAAQLVVHLRIAKDGYSTAELKVACSCACTSCPYRIDVEPQRSELFQVASARLGGVVSYEEQLLALSGASQDILVS